MSVQHLLDHRADDAAASAAVATFADDHPQTGFNSSAAPNAARNSPRPLRGESVQIDCPRLTFLSVLNVTAASLLILAVNSRSPREL